MILNSEVYCKTELENWKFWESTNLYFSSDDLFDGVFFCYSKLQKKINYKKIRRFISCFALWYTLVRINSLKVCPLESLQKGVRSRDWCRDRVLPNQTQVEPERWSCFFTHSTPSSYLLQISGVVCISLLCKRALY